MKLNINKESIKVVEKQKSPIKKRETIKGTEVVPFIENSQYYCIIDGLKYRLIVEDTYKPIYRFSTDKNDKYIPGTIKQGFKEISYKDLSEYWTYLSTTIPIKVSIIGLEALAKTSMLNYIYSVSYKEYCKNEYRKRGKT